MPDAVKLHESFERDGMFIVKGLIGQQQINLYKEHYERKSHEWRYSESEQKQHYLHFPFRIHERDSMLSYMLNQRAVLDLVGELLGGVYRPQIVISIVDWVSIGQDWHTDRPRANLFGNYDTTYSPTQYGAWIALDEIKRESGPFGFIRGSNRIDRDTDDYYLKKKFEYEERLLSSGRVAIRPDGTLEFDTDRLENASINEQILHLYSDFFSKYVSCGIEDGRLIPEVFLAEPGDVLFWSDHTIHCAHKSENGFLRKSIIGHYCK